MWPFGKKEEVAEGDVFAKARQLLKSAVIATRGKKGDDKAQLEREVRELYSEPDGTIPDLTTLERARSHRIRNWLIATTVFFGLLATAAWAGFFVFKPFGAWGPEDFDLAIEMPESVKSGEEATVTIRYRNVGRTALSSLEITAKMPPGFIVRKSDPVPIGPDRWVLGSLSAGSSGSIVLTGKVLGVPSSLVDMRAFATYVPMDFNSPFQAVGSGAFTIVGSTMELTATSTERVMPGEPLEATFSWGNYGSDEVKNAGFRVALPPGFVTASSSPGPTDGKSFWKLGTLAPGAEGKVKIRGSFDSSAKGAAVFTGDLGYDDAGTFVLQATTSTSIGVIGGDLVISTLVNGSMGAMPVNFGDTLHISIDYANRSEAELGDVTLVARFAGQPTVDGKTVFTSSSISEASKGTVSANSIVWTKKEVPELEKLAPGDEGSFDVTLKLAGAPFAPGAKTYSLDFWVEGAAGTVNKVAKTRKVTSTKMTFPFYSDLRFKAESRYYNDDEEVVGTGPLPPKAGSETTYRIFWTVENALHELSNLNVETKLPDNVRFTGKNDVSAGELKYDADKKIMIWSLNRMPTSIGKATMDFEVGLTPSSAAIGNILPLTGEARLDVLDTVANGHILKTLDAVDTSLAGDPLGRGKGVVAK